jgi:hypothetical protein
MMTKDAKIQDICLSWIFVGTESLMFVVRFFFWCVLFVCKLMVFQVCNSIEMNFWIGFGDGAGLLLQLGWLLNEECGSRSWRLVGARDWMEVNELIMDYKQRSLGLQKITKWSFSIIIREKKSMC